MQKPILFVIFYCILAIASVSAQQTVRVSVIQSARDTSDLLTPQPSIYFSNNQTNATQRINIDTFQTFQTILGFGGAFTEAAAYVYSQMDIYNQQIILNAYWGAAASSSVNGWPVGGGLNYTVGRVHMNSCDFSLASYSEDDTSNDFTLENFTISHDQLWLIPLIKDALSVSENQVNLFLTPWSPPAWMKSNGQMDGSDTPGLLPDDIIHSSWALFFSKFITAYAEEGINFWGLTVQNEPEFAAPWEACVYTPEQERDFVKNFLGPQIKKDHPEVKIMIYDHNKDDIVKWVDTIYSDPEAAQFVDGTAFHWYSGPQFDHLAISHELYPEKFLLATEACNCPNVTIGDWARGESYGYDIIGDLNNWSVGWTDWNLLLDLEGGPNHLGNLCDACIICDTENQVVYFQPSYYYMGQISKFIAPGSIRVATSTPDDLLSVTGFLTPDNNVVVVVMNQWDFDVDIELQSNGLFAGYTMPGHSITTFLYENF